jgi:hypothetical protein
MKFPWSIFRYLKTSTDSLNVHNYRTIHLLPTHTNTHVVYSEELPTPLLHNSLFTTVINFVAHEQSG